MVVLVVVASVVVVVVVEEEEEVVVVVHKVFFLVFGAWKLAGKTTWIYLVGLFQSKKRLKVTYPATKLPETVQSEASTRNSTP